MNAGKELFTMQCLPCHTIDGKNSILLRTRNFTQRGLEAELTGLGKVNTYMPPFAGNEAEKKVLAAYIYQEVMGKPPVKQTAAKVTTEDVLVPPFDTKKDEYVLLAWNDLGMHCISDNDKYFSFLPPANTFWAQLYKRGEKPALMTNGVTIKYEVEDGYKHPEKHVLFWDYAPKIYGAKLEPGTGLAGKKVVDVMDPGDLNSFIAQFVPVTPYRDDGTYNPYPLFHLTAIDSASGKVLARTTLVTPTSTEMGCRNCHGGGWRVNNYSGLADKTAENLLAAHDRMNNTTLLSDALAGNPHLCQECHADPAIGAPGKPGILNFSSAMHGFHANYLTGMNEESCNMCHPSSRSGNTQCLRGRHNTMGVNCTDCHGKIEDHALSLLTLEAGLQKPAAERLMENLTPVMEASKAKIHPRMPWLQEPDCLSCHTDFNIRKLPKRPVGFNKWVAGGSVLYRNRPDYQGVMCEACHGSTHAVYFATNKYGIERDNLQPIQYQNLSGTIGTKQNCRLCHMKDMNTNGHHRNMIKGYSISREPVMVDKKDAETPQDSINEGEKVVATVSTTLQTRGIHKGLLSLLIVVAFVPVFVIRRKKNEN